MQGPLENLEQWDDFVKDRYDPNRKQDEFRKFTLEAPPVVQEFYRQNHTYQTRDFVLQKKREYLPLNKRRWGYGRRWSISTRWLTTATRIRTCRKSSI